MINENSGVTYDTAHGACTMLVDLTEFLALCWLHEFADHFLLDSENNAIVSLDTNRCTSVLLTKKLIRSFLEKFVLTLMASKAYSI